MLNKDDHFWICALETNKHIYSAFQITELRHIVVSVKRSGRFIEFCFQVCCFAWNSSSKNLMLNFINGSFYIGFLSVTTQTLCALPSVMFVIIRITL